MRKLVSSVLIIFACAQVCFGGAYFKTGMALLADGREWNKYYRGEKEFSISGTSYFQGFVCGVLDAHGETIKTPDGFTTDQACAIVLKYLADHPKRLNEAAAVLIRDALRDAYGR